MSLRVLGWVLSLSLVLSAEGQFTAGISERTVTARGLTPGGGAVFFSVAHEPRLAYYTIRRVAHYVEDADGDGIVSHTVAEPIPYAMVWLVIDADAGTIAAATLDDSAQRFTQERVTVAKKDVAGEWARLTSERSWLEMVVVRPKKLAWELTVMRGGAADVDKRDERFFDTPLELFRPLSPGAPALKHLKKGDVLVAIDPERLEYFVVGVE